MVNFSKNFDCVQNIRKLGVFRKFRKISILGKIFQNFDFFENFDKLKKFRFWAKFLKISKNFDFSQIFINFEWGEIFKKISILVKIFEISIDFVFFLNFEIYRFWSKFLKNFDAFEKFRLVKFSKNMDLGQSLRKNLIITVNFDLCHFLWNNCDFRQNFPKICNWVKFSENFDFIQNI